MNDEYEIDAVSQDAKNISLLVWIGTFFFNFIPGLIAYLIKADDPYIKAQAKEALNWSITALIISAIGTFLTIILIGFVIQIVVVLCNLIFCIMGAVATAGGKPFRVPFAIRLIK